MSGVIASCGGACLCQHGGVLACQHGGVLACQHGGVLACQHGGVLVCQHGCVLSERAFVAVFGLASSSSAGLYSTASVFFRVLVGGAYS